MTRDDELLPADLAELERRAAAVREKPSVAGEEKLAWIAEFPVGDASYALPLDALRAALPLHDVVPVPLAARHVMGILSFEGQIVPALSTCTLVGAAGWRRDPCILVVVDAGGGRTVALDCERVPRTTALPASHVRDARARESGPITPVPSEELGVVHIIDLARLLEAVEGPRAR